MKLERLMKQRKDALLKLKETRITFLYTKNKMEKLKRELQQLDNYLLNDIEI